MVHQVLGLKYAKKIKQKIKNYFLLNKFSKSVKKRPGSGSIFFQFESRIRIRIKIKWILSTVQLHNQNSNKKGKFLFPCLDFIVHFHFPCFSQINCRTGCHTSHLIFFGELFFTIASK